MTSYVPAALRKLVAQRAEGTCEYCLIHEDDTFFGCEIEHVIAEKHGGATALENLAYACVFCNRHKGSDIASLIPGNSEPTRLFNPRSDRWADHFNLGADGVTIEWITDIGRVTVALLELNHIDRLIERASLRSVRRYPSESAIRRMAR